MNWFQKAYSFVRFLTLGAGSRILDDDAPSAAGVPVNERSVLALSAAWACVNLLAGTIASLPLMVYRTDSKGGRTVAYDHPLYRVLHDSPNADQTAVDFWEGGCVAIEVHGNMHAHIEWSGERVIALNPICDPTARRLANGDIRYAWSANGRSYDEGSENVLHIRGFGGDPLGGMSTLSYGRQVFGIATAIDRSAASTFRNGLRPSGVLTYPNFLKPEQRTDLKGGLQGEYAGAMNAGRPLVLEGGTTWTQLSLSPEDSQMLQSRGFSVEEVCRFFGVPPFLVGHTEKTTSFGTGLEQQILGFQKFTLRRRLKRIEQAIAKQLLTARDRATGIVVEFNLEGLLRGDSAARTAFYSAALNNGWMTINEVRALENLPPVAGGEVPRMQIQNVPITEAGKVQAVSPPQAEEFLMFLTKDSGVALDVKAVGEDGTIEGYGSVFGNVDSAGEIVEPGAFTQSLFDGGRKGRKVRMLWQHDRDQPIGVWDDLSEDKKGLFVKGRLLKDVSPRAAEAYGLLKGGALDGLSIGYHVVEASPHPDKNGILSLKKLDLREVSIVTFAANEKARVEDVKSILATGALPTVRQFEEHLRDAGFSKSLAAAIAAKATPHLRGDPEASAEDPVAFLQLLLAN